MTEHVWLAAAIGSLVWWAIWAIVISRLDTAAATQAEPTDPGAGPSARTQRERGGRRT